MAITAEDLRFAVVALSAIFFVVDPLAAVPIFLTITSGDRVEKRRRTARRAAAATFATLALFAVGGGVLFQALGISLASFKTAGGILLLLMAIDMMRAQPSRTRSTVEEQEEGEVKDDVAIVPLAVPMLAGPGAIATVMVLMGRAAWRPASTIAVFVAIAVTTVSIWLLFRWVAAAERFLSQTAVRVFERIAGLLLASIAVEFIVSGLAEMFPAIRA